ncbi:MAG: hypothetical protein R3A45_10410 [Bdellovibrionota bacterium]
MSLLFVPIHYPQIAKLVLVDADTDQPIPGYDPLMPGANIDLAVVRQNLNILAVTNPRP